MESLHSLQWGDSEVYEISNCKSHLSMLGVGITLLTILGGLETLTNQLDLPFGLLQNIGSENLPFTGMRQFRGVRYFRLYRASNGAICKLDW